MEFENDFSCYFRLSDKICLSVFGKDHFICIRMICYETLKT